MRGLSSVLPHSGRPGVQDWSIDAQDTCPYWFILRCIWIMGGLSEVWTGDVDSKYEAEDDGG